MGQRYLDRKGRVLFVAQVDTRAWTTGRYDLDGSFQWSKFLGPRSTRKAAQADLDLFAAWFGLPKAEEPE